MSITTKMTNDGEYHIFLEQTFDFNAISEFRVAYEQADRSKLKSIYLDFRNTHYIDSSALGMLINMQKHMQGYCSTYKIINANDQLRKIFLISHFDKKFEIA